MFAAIAEFERSIISKRADAGRRAAMERGVRFGAKRKLSKEDVVSIRNLMAMGESVSALTAMYGVGRATFYRALGRDK